MRTTLFVAIALLVTASLVIADDAQVRTDDRSIELVCKAVPTLLEYYYLPDTLWVPIWLANNQVDDGVAGFKLRLESTRPDLVRFEIDSTWWLIDSLCLSYDGDLCTLWQYDTLMQVGGVPFHIENSITSDWDFVEVYSPNADGVVVEINGYTSDDGFPAGFDTLIRVRAYTTDLLTDSLCDTLDAAITINYEGTWFTDSNGEFIGCSSIELLVDTLLEDCLEWDSDTCRSRGDTTIDSSYQCELDPEKVLLIDGDLHMPCCSCLPGDANGDEIMNITDAVTIIQYIFNQGSIFSICSADVNCDCIVNISDVVWLIQIIFIGDPYASCTCEEWLANCGPPLR
ncbi:MAG: dockerin type I repeat-containing protein [bacterium]